ncbi:ribonuclease P protein component [Gordonia sp. ABSL49_1]|uniref:ribonuclease P protein component n=1 Tax=Gordonia sp. ABSL49_1 TaxID=2920941 RepID=UPI001F0E9AAA|nr:ribonuclease P protein component [Gordonia sp. ABSL49_1]MCH5641357.1 ribonuclease P protein component [Gordonia sp. ABSL49_1]
MTAPRHRISRRSDFSRTLRNGVRVSSRDLVVHASPVPTMWPDPRNVRSDVAMTGGPWLGLIVSKAVGPAVTRHAVARRLRAAFAETMQSCPSPETFVVVRAHRSAALRSSVELAEQLQGALTHPRLARLGDRP